MLKSLAKCNKVKGSPSPPYCWTKKFKLNAIGHLLCPEEMAIIRQFKSFVLQGMFHKTIFFKEKSGQTKFHFKIQNLKLRQIGLHLYRKCEYMEQQTFLDGPSGVVKGIGKNKKGSGRNTHTPVSGCDSQAVTSECSPNVAFNPFVGSVKRD